MSTEQLLAEILRLPIQQRKELIEKASDSLDDDAPKSEISPKLRAELERRHQNMIENPDDEFTWEEACVELDKRRKPKRSLCREAV